MLERLREGKNTEADVDQLQEIMRQKPGELSKCLELCEVAFGDAICLAVGTNPLANQLILDRREALRIDLGYADALPLERLLIDEIAMAQLRHQTVELRYTAVHKDSLTVAQGEYWEKKLAASQRRYLRAVETLARVRKVLRSVTLQVNIGEKQVNIAGGGQSVDLPAQRAAQAADDLTE